MSSKDQLKRAVCETIDRHADTIIDQVNKYVSPPVSLAFRIRCCSAPGSSSKTSKKKAPASPAETST